MRRAIGCGGVIAALALAPLALAGAAPRDARIAGRVLVCNVPNHCMTRHFHVAAINSAGHTVARAATRGAHNAYRLRLAPGDYRLVAQSHGLVCKASASASAHETTHQNITCLVP